MTSHERERARLLARLARAKRLHESYPSHTSEVEVVVLKDRLRRLDMEEGGGRG